MHLAKKSQLLIFCTELATIRAITDGIGRLFDIVWLRDTHGLETRAPQSPQAVIVDNGVPQISAIKALATVRQITPSTRRILITDHCDLGLIVEGLHTGAVERIVYKPIYAPELLAALDTQNLTAIGMPPIPSAQHHAPPPRAIG